MLGGPGPAVPGHEEAHQAEEDQQQGEAVLETLGLAVTASTSPPLSKQDNLQYNSLSAFKDKKFLSRCFATSAQVLLMYCIAMVIPICRQ